jgi:hypothetical protein
MLVTRTVICYVNILESGISQMTMRMYDPLFAAEHFYFLFAVNYMCTLASFSGEG